MADGYGWADAASTSHARRDHWDELSSCTPRWYVEMANDSDGDANMELACCSKASLRLR